jgi:hypothetical protein
MIALAITAALILVGLGAWLRAKAMTQANPDDDEPTEREPHDDDRWTIG